MASDRPESTNKIVTSDPFPTSRSFKFPKIKTPNKKIIAAVLVVALATLLAIGTSVYNANYKRTTATDARQVITKFEHVISDGKTGEGSGGVLSAYQAKGDGFSVKPQTASFIEYKVASSDLKKTYNKARHILSYQGLTAKPVGGNSTNATPNEYYDNASVHCSLIVSQPTDDYSLRVACASSSAYAAAAKQLKPFYDLYAANNPQSTGHFIVNDIVTKDSMTKGYKTAIALIVMNDSAEGSTDAYYYQTPDSGWHYFKATLLQIACSDYNTVDLKKAFAGQTCYDDAANPVQVSLN